MYIIHDDVRWCTSFSTSWCTVVQHHGTSWCVMHIIYDVKLCTSSSNMIQNDVHQVTSYVMYITNTYDVSWCAMIWHRFFSNFFLEILNSCIFLFQRVFAKGRTHHNPSFYHLYNTSFFPNLSSCEFHAQLIMWQFSFICTLVTCEHH